MAMPLSQKRARAAIRWLLANFGDTLRASVEGTPFGVELLCGIACQETASLWLPFVDAGTPAATVLARSIGDASGDAPRTRRSAFPRNTAAFRERYGDAFADDLIAEANASRALRGMGPKPWVYKGYGIFQYDLQHVATDEAFFREHQWYDLEACLNRVVAELTAMFKRTGELWSAVKAYNGSGPRAAAYRDNVKTFSEWTRDELGRPVVAAPEAPAPAASGKSARVPPRRAATQEAVHGARRPTSAERHGGRRSHMKRATLRFGHGFRVVLGNRRGQAATMTLAPGQCEGGPDNRHRGADQWLFVDAGTGVAIVNGRRVALRRGSLLLIERGDRHEIRNTGRTPLRTLNLYVPPAYTKAGDELPRGRP